MEKKLLCGAAKRCITPPETLLPRLYGLMGRKFCTVLDDIYLRVIAFSDGENKALIVGFDLDKAPRPEENLRALALRAFGDNAAETEIDAALGVFLRRFATQQFKRAASPDGPKVGTVALSPRGDWRAPSDFSPALFA